MEFLQGLLADITLTEALTWAFAIVGAASSIAAVTPTAKDNRILKVIRKVLDALAMNVGNAKNKE
jgi:hypothetical protein